MKPEQALKVKLKNHLKQYKQIHWVPYSSTFGVGGFPDRFGYIKSEPCAIPFEVEVKTPGKELTPRQQKIKEILLSFNIPVLSPCTSVQELESFISPLLRQADEQTKKYNKEK